MGKDRHRLWRAPPGWQLTVGTGNRSGGRINLIRRIVGNPPVYCKYLAFLWTLTEGTVYKGHIQSKHTAPARKRVFLTKTHHVNIILANQNSCTTIEASASAVILQYFICSRTPKPRPMQWWQLNQARILKKPHRISLPLALCTLINQPAPQMGSWISGCGLLILFYAGESQHQQAHLPVSDPGENSRWDPYLCMFRFGSSIRCDVYRRVPRGTGATSTSLLLAFPKARP